MLRQITWLIVLSLFLLASSCSSGPPAANYASFEPSKGQWVIEVTGMAAADTEKVRLAIESISSVQKDSALAHPTGQYVAFKTTV